MGDLRQIPINLVDPDPAQPRQYFDEASLQELAESITIHGQLQPIEVEQTADGRYLIHHGERRWRAHQIAGLTTIQAIIAPPLDERTRLIRGLVENLQRGELNVIEEAHAFRRLRQMGCANQEISRQTGRSLATIAERFLWLELEEEIQEMAARGDLPRTGRVAKALLSISNQEARLKFARQAAEKRLNYKAIQAGVNALQSALIRKRILAASNGANGHNGTDRHLAPALQVAFYGEVKTPDATAAFDWPSIRQSARQACQACSLHDLTGVEEPAWLLVLRGTQQTCEKCPNGHDTDLSICKECPLPALLLRLAGVAVTKEQGRG